MGTRLVWLAIALVAVGAVSVLTVGGDPTAGEPASAATSVNPARDGTASAAAPVRTRAAEPAVTSDAGSGPRSRSRHADAAPTAGHAGRRVAGGAEQGQTAQRIAWRRSRAIGRPNAGRLENGVLLPAEGRHHFTWDSADKVTPSREWRRWGTDRLVRTILTALDDYHARNPGAPRVGIGDLSRPQGGEFGSAYGGLGHVSHQNGLDVDLYYPRLDRRERRPHRPELVDRALAQDLVDAFVAAGARFVFVGPSLDLHGPPAVVQPLAHHDDHIHVRVD